MRQNMKFDTNIYQLRESVLKRMIQIIQQQRYIEENSIVFFMEIPSLNIMMLNIFLDI